MNAAFDTLGAASKRSLSSADTGRTILVDPAGSLDETLLFAQAAAVAKSLPAAPNLINLCEHRGRFLIGFVAALIAGRRTLLPPSRAPRVVAEVAASHGPAAVIDDALVAAATIGVEPPPAQFVPPLSIEPERVVVVGFTSGSTGAPQAHAKTWRAFTDSNARNVQALRSYLAEPFHVLATVPSQHMYGIESCVLLPLLGPAAIAVPRPLFPADLAQALASLPRPRLLVTTPVHLRAFLAADLHYPAPDLIVSATAPLPAELALAVEQRFDARLLEWFGSTETCVIGHRRTAHEEAWTLYPELRLQAVDEGTRVHAPYFPQPILLRDHVRQLDDGRFVVEGRCQDMIEIAGKRASLGDIGQRLLAIEGVDDAVVVQCAEGGCGVQRLVAVIVAPGIDDAGILAALRPCLDPAFMPRRLVRVERLPRNETGKLRHADLLAILGRTPA